jgi:hypothetical protein
LVGHVATPRLTSVVGQSGMQPWDEEQGQSLHGPESLQRHARSSKREHRWRAPPTSAGFPIRSILPVPIAEKQRRAPTCPPDPWPGSATNSGGAQRSMARLYPSQVSAGQAAVSPVNATRRRPRRLASGQRTVLAIREQRLLRQARWRHPPPRIAPGRHGRTGQRPRRPTAPPRRPAKTRLSHRGSRPAARRHAADTTAGSTGGDGPTRCRRRLVHTSGTAAGGRDESRARL